LRRQRDHLPGRKFVATALPCRTSDLVERHPRPQLPARERRHVTGKRLGRLVGLPPPSRILTSLSEQLRIHLPLLAALRAQQLNHVLRLLLGHLLEKLTTPPLDLRVAVLPALLPRAHVSLRHHSPSP